MAGELRISLRPTSDARSPRRPGARGPAEAPDGAAARTDARELRPYRTRATPEVAERSASLVTLATSVGTAGQTREAPGELWALPARPELQAARERRPWPVNVPRSASTVRPRGRTSRALRVPTRRSSGRRSACRWRWVCSTPCTRRRERCYERSDRLLDDLRHCSPEVPRTTQSSTCPRLTLQLSRAGFDGRLIVCALLGALRALHRRHPSDGAVRRVLIAALEVSRSTCSGPRPNACATKRRSSHPRSAIINRRYEGDAQPRGQTPMLRVRAGGGLASQVVHSIVARSGASEPRWVWTGRSKRCGPGPASSPRFRRYSSPRR